jgi:translation initiation factor IF-2
MAVHPDRRHDRHGRRDPLDPGGPGAEVLKVPVDRLLAQLEEAGITVSGPQDRISEDAKHELLTHLRKAHGKAEDGGAPRKITLRRKAQSEIKVAAPMGKARTVSVEVRRQRTYIKRDVLEEQARMAQEEVDRQREAEDAERLAVEEKLRLDVEEKEQQRREREESERRSAEENSRRAAEEQTRREAEQKAREQAEKERRQREEKARKTVEDDKNTRYGRQELHIAGGLSARHKKGRARPESRRRAASVGGDRKHGFELPTQPMQHEVAVGETITVAELAQRMAVKSSEVMKTMLNMGVIATINQPVDQDTAVLVIEEMGHVAKVLKADQVEEAHHRRHILSPAAADDHAGVRRLLSRHGCCS